MKHILFGSMILCAGLVTMSGCRKSVDPIITTDVKDTTQSTVLSNPTVPYPLTAIEQCSFAPFYGDSIVFPQPVSTDNFIYPQNNQGITGTYLSWPQGLNIDPHSGKIDLSRSETGLRYSVGFVKSGTTDTCLAQLIVGGVAYMDSVYVLSNSDTTSRPYFNANPYSPSPCSSSSGPGSGCQFDYNDYARHQGIIVDKKSGFIDLKKTTKDINFAKLINGQSLITRIYYKLNDQSNNSPQMLEIKLVYYKRKSDIPASVLSQVSNNLKNTLTNALIGTGPSVRPPLIIIVRDN